MIRYQFAISELRKCSPYDLEQYDRIMRGERGLANCLKETIMLGYDDDSEADEIDEELIEDILRGMNQYLKSYNSIPAFKQRRWMELVKWVKNMDCDEDIDIDDMVDEFLFEPVQESTAVAVLKLIQGEDVSLGKTKKELAKEIGVSDKAIQKTLHSLDSSLDQKKKDGTKTQNQKPLRFAGQLLNVDIKLDTFVEKPFGYEEPVLVDDDEEKVRNVSSTRYYSPEACNPVALQMSVYQAGTMLKGLQLTYNRDISFNSLNIAINIWSQLSEYCKTRLREKYHPEDEEFREFIKLVNEKEQGDPFVTEVDIFDKESLDSKLNLAFKGDRRCDVQLKNKVLRDCRIVFEPGASKYAIYCGDKKYDATGIEAIALHREE